MKRDIMARKKRGRKKARRYVMTSILNDDKTWVKIENVVATASLKHGIDIGAVCRAFPKSEYRPEIFPGLVFRLNRPKTVTLIFSSGKMVCTGAKSEKDSIGALKKVVRSLKRENIIMISGKPEIQTTNIVASVNFPERIDLFRFYQECGRTMGGRIMYEPDQFPGLIYRMEDPRAVILVFSTGKLVCTGTKTEADVYRAVKKLRQRLEEYNVIYGEALESNKALGGAS